MAAVKHLFQSPHPPSGAALAAPGAADGLVVDGVPVLLAELAVVQVVADHVVSVSGLLPLELHRGVRVPDGQDGAGRGRRRWWESGETV